MPGQSLIGSVATFESSSVTWPVKPGSMKPGRRVGQQAEAAERALALEARRDVVGQRDRLVGRGQHELARMQDERLVGPHLDEVGELGLILGRIDERVLVVVEQPEVPVEAHVDRRRLDHPRFVGLQPDALAIEFGPDVTIREKHAASVATLARMASVAPSPAQAGLRMPRADVVQW